MTETLLEGPFYTLSREEPLFVMIGAPAPDPQSTQGDCYCPDDIKSEENGSDVQRHVAFGVNGLQAVEMVFALLRHRWPIVPGPDGTPDRT
ncbi:MAG: hypothetical protein MPJ78_17410 [Hyphomicrobiaceae bacterium]|nr:hypothetical protein [Hyphomicrobiaceae bacterium]